MAGEVFLGKVEAGCHWGQEGGTPGFSLKASNIFGAQGFRDVFMTCGVKGFERGLAPSSPTSASVISRTVNIAYEYLEIIAKVGCPTVCSSSHCTLQVLCALS